MRVVFQVVKTLEIIENKKDVIAEIFGSMWPKGLSEMKDFDLSSPT